MSEEMTPFVLVGVPDEVQAEVPMRQFGPVAVPVYNDVLVSEQIRVPEVQRWLDSQLAEGKTVTQTEYDLRLVSLFLTLRVGAEWTVERLYGLKSKVLRELADFFRSELAAAVEGFEDESADPKSTTSEPSTAESTGSSEPNTPESPASVLATSEPAPAS